MERMKKVRDSVTLLRRLSTGVWLLVYSFPGQKQAATPGNVWFSQWCQSFKSIPQCIYFWEKETKNSLIFPLRVWVLLAVKQQIFITTEVNYRTKLDWTQVRFLNTCKASRVIFF